ncbi:MAG: hypothetical protein R6V10_11015 [bacterium]
MTPNMYNNQNNKNLIPRRILAFSSKNPSVIDIYDKLAGFLEREGFKLIFLVPFPSVKMEFYKRGLEAYSLTELVEYTVGTAPVKLNEHTARKLYDYDLRVERKPKLPVVDPFNAKSAEYYHWAAEQMYKAIRELFQELDPCMVFSWNTCSLPSKILSLLASEKGVPTFYLERGLLPDTVVIDPMGVNYGSHVAGERWKGVDAPVPDEKENELADRFCRYWREKGATIVPGGRGVSDDDIYRELGIPPDASVLLFPLQIEKDSNIISYSPFYKSMPEIISDLAEVSERIEKLYVIIKPHPEDRDRLEELRKLCSDKMLISLDYGLQSLFNVTDVVMAVNSTVGLEALTRRKQVVILGNAVYGEKGFTFDLNSPERLEQTIREALECAEKGVFNEKEFKRFLVYLLKRCLFSLLEEDPWQSRANILAMMKDSIGERSIQSPPASKLTKDLSQNRECVEKLFKKLEKKQISGNDILVIKPYVSFLAYEGSIFKYNPKVIDRRNLLRRLPGILMKKHEYVICVGRRTRRVKMLMKILRTNKKISLP